MAEKYMYVDGKKATKITIGNSILWDKPFPHRELPYCISNSFSWCDTGLHISPNIHQIKTKSMILNLNNKSYANVYLYMGTRTSYSTGTTKANVMILKKSDSSFVTRRDWGQSTSAPYDTEILTINHEFDIILNPEYTEINGIRKIVPEGNYPLTKFTLFIGAMNEASVPVNGQYKANAQRIYPYEVSIYETGEIILDLVPVMMDETNEIRIFDRKSETYLTNIGTQPFEYDGL